MVDFANFDPTKEGGDSTGDKPILPPGIFVLVIKRFKRSTSRAGNDSLLFICQPMFAAGGKVYDGHSNVLENCTLTSAASWRLANLCKAVGWNRPFNAMSDEEVREIFVRKPIKASVIHDTYGGKVSVKIKEYFPLVGSDVERVKIMMEDWQIDGDSGDSYSGGEEYQTGTLPEDVPPPTDDDLPF